MFCERAALVVGVVMALVQARVAQHAAVASVCSGGGVCGTGAAQSQTTDASGYTTGECAYLNSEGEQVKIAYRQAPNGQVEAEADPPVRDAVAALATCRRAAEVAAQAAQQTFDQTQRRILQQQQQLQQELLRQNQIFQQRFNFPQNFGFPNGFQFPHYPFNGFGPV